MRQAALSIDAAILGREIVNRDVNIHKWLVKFVPDVCRHILSA